MKKILFNLILLMTCLTSIGFSIAYFADVETSADNNLTAGTLDLQVSDGNEVFGDGVTATWTMTNMQPGIDITGPHSVVLRNSGTVAADHLEISFSHTIDELSNPVASDSNPVSIPGDLARWIEITGMDYAGTGFLVSHIDANLNGIFDLEDITMSPYTDAGGPLDNLPAPPPDNGGETVFTMTLKANAGATDDIQGDILTTTVMFTLNQDSGQ